MRRFGGRFMYVVFVIDRELYWVLLVCFSIMTSVKMAANSEA